MDALNMDGTTDAVRATGSEGSPAASPTLLTTGTKLTRAASATWLRDTRSQRQQQRVATYRRMFSRYLPFTGWRLPIQVESAISRFKRIMGGPRGGVIAMSARSSALGIDYDRGIWRTSSLESLERRKVFSVSLGHVDEAYVDDSWADLSAGDTAAWSTAAGDEISLVYGYDAFATIAEGVAATEAGGILNIAEGGYSEILTTLGKGLTIRAGGDAAAEVAVDGLQLAANDMLEFDLPGVSRHDQISLRDGASVFDLGAARISVAESADLPTDGSAVLGLITSERGVSVGPTGTVYDHTGHPLANETILSSSRLNFRFDGESGDFQGVFLTPVLPPTEVVVDGLLASDPADRVSVRSQTLGSGGMIGTAQALPSLVYVYDAWTGSTVGETVTYGSISATFGTNAFATIGTGLAGVAASGTVDVIAGSAGVYNEQLSISQDVTIAGIEPSAPVTAMGADADAAVLDGAGLFGAGITVTGAGVDLTLRNIAFSNWLDGSILVQNGGSAVVENVTINGDVSGVASVTRGMRVEAGSTLNVSKSIVQAGEGNYGANNGIQVTGAGAVFTLSNSSVTGSASVNQVGVAVSGGTATVTNSFVTGNFYGILFSNASNGSVTGSFLAGNTQSAVRNSTSNSAVIDASTNWWGVTTEAAVLAKTSSTGGSRVDITPYLLDGTDTGNVTAGFQGDYSQLAVTTLGPQVGSTGRIQEGVTSIANGSLTGIDRVLEVNTGNYTDATNVSQSLTLETASFNLNSSLTFSAPSQVAEAANGGGAAITVLNGAPGNNLAVNANLAFVGNGTLSLTSGNGSIVGSGVISAGTLSLTSTNGSVTASTDAASLSATGKGDITIGDAGDITFTGVTSSTGNVGLTAVGNLATSGSVTATVGDVSLLGATLALAGTTTAGDSLALEATAGNVNLVVANLSIGQDLSVVASGEITQDGALTVPGNTTLNAGNGITLMAANVLSGTVAISSIGDVALNDSTPLAFANSTITGNLAVTAGGAITAESFSNAQVLQITGTTSLSAGAANDITLDGANDFGGAVRILSGKNVSLNDANAIDLGASEISGNLAVTANGSITDSGVLNVTGTTSLNAGSANDITLDEANVLGGTVSVVAGRNVSLNDTGALDLGPSTISGNLFQVTAGGAITDSGNLSVSGNTELTAGSGNDITLDNANDFIGSVSVVSGKDVTLVDTSSIDLAASTISGNLAVTANGTITASGNLSITGTTSLGAGAANDITLDDANDFVGAVSVVSGRNVSLADTGAVDLGASTITGNLTVTSNGSITDSGNLSITGTTSLTAGSANDITLDAANNFNGAVSVVSGKDVSLNDIGDIDLGVSTVSGNLVITANGSITDSGVLTITGTTNLTSLGLIPTAPFVPTVIVLDAGNDFIGAVLVMANGNVVLNDINSIDLGASTVLGNLTITTDRAITDSGNLSISGTTSLTAGTQVSGNITLDAANNFGGAVSVVNGDDVTLNDTGAIDLGASTISGNLTVTAAGTITDSGNLSISGTTTLTAGSANDITLNNANDFVGAVSVVSGKNVALNDTGDIDLGASTISGNLAVTSGGAITSSGVVSAVGVNATAAGSIDLNLAAASLDATANGSITVTEADAITLGNVTSTNGSIDVTAGGPLTVGSNGTVSANQSLTLIGSTLAFSGTTISGSDITLNATAGGIDVGGLNLGGNLSATAAGELTVIGTLEAVGDVTLTGANVAVGSSVTAGDDVFLSATAGNISGSGLVSGDAVSATATGSIDLNLAAASLLATADGNITVVESDALTLDLVLSTNGTARVTAGGDLTVGIKGVTAADVYLTGSNIAVAQSITSGSDVTLNATAGNIIGGGLITGNLLRATAANGSVAMATNVATVTGASSGPFSVTESSGLTLGNVSSVAGDVDVVAEGSLDINGSVSAGSNVTLTSTNGSIAGPGSVSGALLTASAANGSVAVATSVSSLTATANGSITLTDTDSITLVGVTSTAGNVAVTAGGDIVVSSNVTSASDVLLNATAGNISGPALILADTVTANATGSIGLNLAVASLDATAGSDITVNDSGSTLLENINSTGGNVTVNSSGDLTVNGSVAAFTDVTLQGTSVTLTGTTTAGTNATLQALAGNLSGSGLVTADAVFAEALEDTRSINLNLATARLEARADSDITVANNGSLTLGVVDGGGNLAMTVAGDLVIGSDGSNAAVSMAGNVTLNVTGGNISGPGTILANGVNATATGSIDLALRAASLAAAATGNITVADEGTLVLNAVTSTAGDVTISSGALVVNGSTTAAGNDVTLNATSGSISGSGLITADAVNATAPGSIGLNLAAASLTANASSSVTVTEADSLVLQTVTSTAGNVTVTAGGDLTVGTSVSANVDLSLTGSNITLDGSTTGYGDITLNATAGGIVLQNVSVGDALTVVANGPITQVGSLPVNGLLTLSAGSANDIVLSNSLNSLPTVVVLSGRDVSLRTSGAMDLGASTISGNLAVTANGSITDSGALLVSGTTVLDAGSGNDITLDAANDFGGAVSIVRLNNLTLNDTGAIDFGTSTVSGNLIVTANGSITDSGNLSVAGTTTLTAGSANDITLDAANDFGGAVSVVSGRNVSLSDTGALDLGASTVSGNLTVTTAGNLTQSAALNITGSTSIIAGTAADPNVFYGITLTDAANDFGGVVNATGATNTRLTDVDAIALGSITTGSLTVVANGHITDEGVLTGSGRTTLTAGSANDITLDQANAFHGVTVVSGRNVTLNDTNSIYLEGATVSGNLAVTAAGFIDGSYGGNPVTVSGTTTFSASSTSDITFPLDNDFIGAVSITSGRNVTLRDVDDIDFGASTISGNLSVTANGSITDSAAISVAGTTSLTSLGIAPGPTSLSLALGSGFVGPVVLTGSASLGDVIAIRPRSLAPLVPGITLDAANDFTGAVSTSATGNVVINDVSAIVLGESTIGGSLTITTNGSITDTGNLSITGATSLTAGSANDITLDAANDFGGSLSVVSGNNVTLSDTGAIDLGASAISGNLAVTANSTITDSGNLSIAGTTSLAAGSANDITLNEENDFGGAVSVVGGRNVALNDVSDIDLGASTVSGNLTVTANGSITDSGALNVTGTMNLTAGSANDITLDDANNFGGAVRVVSGRDVALNDTGAITLATSTVSGNLTVTANGSITDSGVVSVTGTTSLSAGSANDITLDSVNDFVGAVSVVSGNNVTLNDTGAIDLGALTVSGNLSVTANGSITDSGVLNVTGTTNLTAGSANDITLDDANDFGGAVSVFTGRNVTLNDSGSLALSAYNIAGNLTVTANGAITDSTAINVTGTTSLSAGAANDITLDAANNFVGAVSVVSGNNVTLNDTGAIDLGASTISGNLAVTANGSITDSGVLNVTGTTRVTAGVANDITLDAANDFGGAVSVFTGRNVTLNDSGSLALSAYNIAGNLTVTANGAITDSTAINVTGTTSLTAGSANDITLDAANNFVGAVSVVSGNNVTLNDTNAIDLGALTISGNLAVTANGTITDSGNLSIAGTTSLAAGSANDITLNEENEFGGAVSVVSGRNVALNDVSDIDLGASTVSGNLTVTANGSITDSGALNATGTMNLTAGSANDVTLDDANNFGGAVSVVSGRDVTLNDDSAIDLGASTVSGNLTVTANGAITDSGNLTITGTTTLAAGAANDITLDNTNNFGGAVSISSADDVVLNDTGAIALGAAQISGNLAATANGTITQTGAINVAGTTALAAGAANAITLPELNTFGGAVSIASGRDVTIQANGGIDLGDSTVSGNLSVTAIAGITDSGNIAVSGSAFLSSGCDSMTLGDSSVVSLTGPVTLVSNRDITLNVSGDLDLVTAGVGGNLAITGSGNLSSSGAVTVGGNSSLTVGSTKTITLTQANDFTGPVSLSSLDASLNDTSGIDLGTVALGGNLAVTANGPITQAGDITVSGTTTLAATGNPITLDRPANNFNTVNTSGSAVTLVDTDGLTLGDTTASSLSVTANGTISQAAGSTINVTGTTTLAAGSGNSITLAEATNDFGTVNGSVSSFGVLTLNDANGIILGNLTAQASQGLNVTANGSITQAAGGAITVFGSRFDSTGHDITLDGSANDFQSNIDTVATGANVTLVDSNALYLGNTTADNLTATANGVIEDYGVINVTGTTTLNATGNAITLDHPANVFGTVNTSGSAITLVDTNGLNFGDTTASSLSVTANGTIAQAAGSTINVTGTTTLAAGSGNSITLAEATNDFGTVNGSVSSSGVITINDANGIILGNLTAQALQGLNVTANGAITQAAGSGITVFGSRFDSTGHDITLDNAANDFQSNIDTVATGANVTLVDTNALALANTTAGNLSATANGVIQDYGVINVTGTTTLSAGSGNDITLDAANDFGGAVSVASGRDVTLNDINAIDLGDQTVSGNISVTGASGITDSGNVSVTGSSSFLSGCGSITLGDGTTLSLGGPVTLLAGQDATLTVSGALDLAATTVDGNLSVTAAGAITDSGNLNVGQATTFAAGSGNNILLDAANDFRGPVSIVSGNNVTLNDVDGIDLGASTVSTDLSVTANGTITDSGNLSVTGLATFAAGSSNDITLDAANELSLVQITSGRDVTLNDITALTLTNSTVSGNLAINANGQIKSQGWLNVVGATELSAGSGDIQIPAPAQGPPNTADFGGPVSVLSATGVMLEDTNSIQLGNVTTTGTLTVTANGSITGSADLDVGRGTVLNATVAHDITLTGANQFAATVTIQGGDDVTLNAASGFNLDSSVVAGNLAITATGDITDTGASTIAGTTTLDAATANITLNAANNFGGAVEVPNANDVTLNDVDAILLGGFTITGNLAITAAGSITDSASAPTPISVGGSTSLAAGSSNDIILDAANDFGGPVSVASGLDVTLNDSGSIDLGEMSVSGNLTVTGATGITDSGNLSVAGSTAFSSGCGSITLGDSSILSLTGPVALIAGIDASITPAAAIDLAASTVGGNLAITANGGITQSGAIVVTGTTTLAAGAANDITLTNVGNDFGGAAAISSGLNVTLADQSALVLGASTVTGVLNASTGGAISGTGTVAADGMSLAAASGGITLDIAAANVTATAVGDISIAQTNNLAVNFTTINSTAGNISLATNGTAAGHGMTIDTLVSRAGAGSVTLAGGVEFLLTSNTTYTQSDISAATLDLSAATLLGSIAGGYNPPVDQTYDIINTSATTTAFSNAANGVVFGNVAFAIDYTGNVTLTAGLPTLVYVDDLWADSTPGQTVSSGTYTGTFGYNAFATIATGVAGVATAGLVGVIEGLYNESITVSRDVTIEGIQPAVPTTEMGAAAGTAMLDGTGLFTAAITASGVGIDLNVSNLQFSEWINGAVLIQGGAAATLTNVTVVGELAGVAASFGVRLQGAGSSLTLDKSIISAGTSAGPNNGVQVTGGTFTMTNSSVSGSASAGQVGVALTGGTAIVSNSFITGNFLGLTFSNTATGTLSGNDLTGNSAYAVRNGTVSSTINASGNWWGAITESGVLAKTFSTGSSGSRVDISPYLLDGTDTGNATAGFQGDFSQLAVTTLGAQAGANAIQEGADAIANGTLTGVNRILLVNTGTYSGATDVNQSLTLTASAFTLTDNLTISADIQAAEMTSGGGTTITVNGAGNNLATNANLAFTGTGTLALELGSGSIAGPGVISASSLTLSAANGSINVASDAGMVTLTSLGDATINDVGAIDLAASTIGGNLAVTANGSITDSGVLNVTGSTSLAAGSANDITLDAANVFGGAVAITSGRDVTLIDTNDLVLASSAVSGNLALTVSGTISQSGPLTVAGTANLGTTAVPGSPRYHSIYLQNAGNDFEGAVSANSNADIQLSDSNAITLGAISASTLFVTANGTITDEGTLTLTGQLILAAGSGNDITLDSANTYGAVTITSGRNVTLNDTRSVDVTASTISGNLALTAAGAITQSGVLAVTGTTTLTAGSANDITLDAANTFGGAVGVVSGRNVTLNDTGAIDLGASTVSGNLAVTANGSITDSGALNVTGTTSLTAGAASDITLDAANDFGGAVTVASGRNVTLNDVSAIDLAASTISGNLTVTANGSITDSGVLNVTGTTTLTAGTDNDITLDAANTFGGAVGVVSGKDVTLNDTGAIDLGASTVSGNLTVTANGSITDSGDITVTGVTTLIANADGSIEFDDAATFGGPVNAQTGGSVYLNVTGSIDLGTVNAGSLMVDANGSITDSGVLTIQGNTDLYSYSRADITLDEANDFGAGGSGRLQILRAGNVTLNDIDDLAIGQIVASGNLTVTANGSITDSGALNVTGTTTLTAGSANDITLDAANNFGGAVSITSGKDVTLNDTGAIDLGASTISGNLAVTANGSITDSGNLSITGTTSLTAGSARDITLDSANTFGGTVGVASGQNVTLNGVSAIDLAASNVSGNLTVTANGSITDSGALNVTGTTTLTAGSANDITLDNENNFVNAVSVASGMNVTLNVTRDLDLGASTISGNLVATVGKSITDSGNLSISGTTLLTVPAGRSITLDADNSFGGAVSIPSANEVSLKSVAALDLGTINSSELGVISNGSITQSGVLNVTGTTTLTAGSTNDITLDAANTFGGAVSLASGRNVTLNDTTSLTLGASAVSGNLTLTTTGNVSQVGGLTVTGTAAITAGTAAGPIVYTIDLSNAANDFGGAVSAAGATDVVLTDANAIVLGTIPAASLTVTALAGSITGSGPLVVSGGTFLTAGASDITLLGANDFGPVTVTSGRNVALNDVSAIQLDDMAVSGNLAVTTDGLVFGLGNLSITGTTTLAAGSANDILLNTANNFGGAVSITSGKDVTLNDTSAITIGNSTISGDLTITAGGAIGDAGTVAAGAVSATTSAGGITLTLTADTVTASAPGSIDISQVGNQSVTFSSINSTGGNVALSTDGTTFGHGMTLDTLSAASNGTVTLSGGIEFMINNGTSYTQSDVPSGQVVLSGATLLVARNAAYYPTLGTQFTLIDSATPISGTFDGVAENGTVDATGVVLRANYTNDLTLTTQSTVPLVTNVYVNSSAWLSGFENYLVTSSQGSATLGYAIPTGTAATFNRNTPNQLNTLSWTNMNEISVSFSEDVVIAQADFALTGVNVASYAVSGFSYGQVGGVWTATWTLGSNLGADKLMVNVPATVVARGGGLQLAGAWTQPTPSTAGSAMPSGGSPGTAFAFRVNSLPGDVNTNTAVTNQDLSITRAAAGTTPGVGLYTIFKDVNGNGAITNQDLSLVQARLATTLPAGEPVAYTFPSASSAAFDESAATSGVMTMDEAKQAAWAALTTDGTVDTTKKRSPFGGFGL